MDVVIVITILIIIIALIVFIILSILNWDTRQYDIVCPVGECPTSLLTGEKDCTRSVYNPSLEVCSTQYGCPMDILPYPITSSLGTDLVQECELDANGELTQCRCSRDSLCPMYTVMAFARDSYGNITQVINLNNEENGSCSTAIESFFTVGGFCTPSDWTSEESKRSDIIRCVQGNPCVQGQAAYIANPSEFRPTDYSYYPVACVPGITGLDSFGNEIEENSLPVWDDQWGGVVQVRV